MEDKMPVMNQKEKRELKRAEVALIVLAVVGLLIVGWIAWGRTGTITGDITSFSDCVKAGYPVRESSPEICSTPSGKQFTGSSEETQRTHHIEIKEWDVHGVFPARIADVYYDYDMRSKVVMVSTKTLDAKRQTIDGCTSGLGGIYYERLKPGDTRDTGNEWTEQDLANVGVKAGQYYYAEKPMIETLCMPEENQATRQIQDIKAALREGMKTLAASD